jgi:hypothetical protein
MNSNINDIINTENNFNNNINNNTPEPFSFMNSIKNIEIRSRTNSKNKNGLSNRSIEISPLENNDNNDNYDNYNNNKTENNFYSINNTNFLDGSYENYNEKKSSKLFFNIEIIRDWLISMKINDAENFAFFNTINQEEKNINNNNNNRDISIKNDYIINKIKNGILLNEILIRLNDKKPKGILIKPKNQAQKLFNLKRIIEILKMKKVKKLYFLL